MTEEKIEEALINEKMLNSEMAYPPEVRLTLEQIEAYKLKDESVIKHIEGIEWNAIVEREFLSHQALDIAEANIRELADDYNKRERQLVDQGLSMVNEPVIPEYLGFSKGEAREGGTIYIKGDYVLASRNGEWTLHGEHASPVRMTFDNQYMALVALKALGVPMDINEILENK